MTSACRGKSLLSTAGLIAAGLIHALCFAAGPLPAWSLAAVQTLMLAVLAHQTLNASSVRRALLQGWLFGFFTYALGVYWIFISLHTYGFMAAPLAAGGVLALAAYLGLYTALACGLARYLLPDRLYERPHRRKLPHDQAALSQSAETVEKIELSGTIVAPPKSRLSPWLQVFLAAITWAGTWATFEWWRGFVLTGFPWLNIGYAHIDSPLAGWAPVSGVYGVALAAAFAAAALAMLPRCRAGARLNRAAAATLFAAVALALCGWGLRQVDWSQPSGKPLSVRLVQGNVEQSEKFDPTLVEHGLMQHMNLVTLPPAAGQPAPTLTLMPETVLPVFQDQADPKVWQIWLRIAAERNTTIVMGVPLHRRDAAGAERYTNSAIGFDAQTPLAQLLDGDTTMRYDKRHLVPFGEYVPTGFRWFVDAMKIPLGDFDRGPTRQTPFPIADQQLALNICYEDLFGEDLLPALHPGENGEPGASILANISNLGWFGDSWALEQHLNIARMRTLETARPMLIATNTGITGNIDSKGRVLARLPTHRADILAVTVQGMAGFTPFARYGDKPVLALMALILIFAFGRRFSGRQKGE